MRDTAGEAPFRHVLAYDFTGHSQMHLNHSTLRQLAIRGEVNPVIADIHGGGFVFRVGSLLYGAEPQWDSHNQAACSTALRHRHGYPLDLGMDHFEIREGAKIVLRMMTAAVKHFLIYSKDG